MKINKCFAALVATGLCLTPFSHAHADGYALMEIGASQARLSTTGFDQAAADWLGTPTATNASVSDDDSDVVWRLGAGYAVSRHLALELFYENLGSYEGSMSLQGTDTQGASAQLDATETVDLSGLGLQVVGMWPVSERFSLLGSAGISRMENERKYRATVENFNSPERAGSQSDSSYEWVSSLGLGGSFRLTEQFAIRGRYTRHFDAGETENLSDFDVDSINLALVWVW